MMIYLEGNRKKKVSFFKYGFLLFVFFVFIYFHQPIFTFLSLKISPVFNPFLIFSQNVKKGVENFNVYFKNKKELFLENQSLTYELNKIQASLLQKNILLSENQYLKDVLKRKKQENDFVLANILSKRHQSVYDVLLIDIGLKDGIVVNNLVFAYGNIPIGKITEVYENYSKVLLFSAPQKKTEVFLNDPSILLEMTGRGGGNFDIILPRDFEIKENTEVFLPSIDAYVVALVKRIISDPRDSFQKILLVSPVNIEHIRFVEVLR